MLKLAHAVNQDGEIFSLSMCPGRLPEQGRRRENCEANFARVRLVILDFRVRLITLK
jgi:hypothetical protein